MEVIRYCKYDRYIFTIRIIVFNQTFEIIEISDMVTDEKFDKINDFIINKFYYNNDDNNDYSDDDYSDNEIYDINDIDNINDNIDDNIDDNLIEQQNIQEDINKIFRNNFDTYEKAFHYNFIFDKQYLLFPNGYSGIYKEWYTFVYNSEDKSCLKMKYYHINGMINGEYIIYYLDEYENKIQTITNYVNNKREGEHKEYYKNGNVKINFKCIDDKIEGEYKEFYDNNNLKIQVNYINSKKEGIYKEYYVSNKLKMEVNYIDNKREGILKYYDEYNGYLKIYDFVNDKCAEYEKDFKPRGLMGLIAYGPADLYLIGNRTSI